MNQTQKDLETIQREVWAWSRREFGGQESKAQPGLVLGPLAPLMGIMEEVGELFDAEVRDSFRDAVGDIAIYLCDYAGREGVTLSLRRYTNWKPRIEPQTALIIALGRLYHVTLKRHQGIRGYDDDRKYQSERQEAVEEFLGCLHALVEMLRSSEERKSGTGTLLHILNETWEQQVSKRNWRANAVTGQSGGLELVPGELQPEELLDKTEEEQPEPASKPVTEAHLRLMKLEAPPRNNPAWFQGPGWYGSKAGEQARGPFPTQADVYRAFGLVPPGTVVPAQEHQEPALNRTPSASNGESGEESGEPPLVYVEEDDAGRITCRRAGETGMHIQGRGVSVLEAIGCWALYYSILRAVCLDDKGAPSDRLLEERFAVDPNADHGKLQFLSAPSRG